MHRIGMLIMAPALLAVSLPISGATGRVDGPKRLSNSRSEFLRRAADQSVNWFPLGPEALATAKETNKPILIEVGASWCPFCRAMDEDSYSNPDISNFINQHFVAVRIDFDIQPDLAHKLELAQSLANLPAGLPLTMFVTPDGELYEGGGFFPAVPAKFKPSFAQFLRQAAGEFENKKYHIKPRDINAELKNER